MQRHRSIPVNAFIYGPPATASSAMRPRDNLGFDATTWGIATGGQRALGNDWFVGASLAYQNSSLTSDASRGEFRRRPAVLRTERQTGIGAVRTGSAGHVGYASYDITATPITGGTVSGTQKQWSASGRLRAAYLHESGNLFIKPRVDLGAGPLLRIRLHRDGGVNALTVDVASETLCEPAAGDRAGHHDDGRERHHLPTGHHGWADPVSGQSRTVAECCLCGHPALPFSHRRRSTRRISTWPQRSTSSPPTPSRSGPRAGASFSENTTAYGGDIKIEFRF